MVDVAETAPVPSTGPHIEDDLRGKSEAERRALARIIACCLGQSTYFDTMLLKRSGSTFWLGSAKEEKQGEGKAPAGIAASGPNPLLPIEAAEICRRTHSSWNTGNSRAPSSESHRAGSEGICARAVGMIVGFISA